MMPQLNSDDLSGVSATSGLNAPSEDLNTPAMQGTMQQVLSENLGRYVVVDFLIGVDLLVRRVGILYSVGRGFLVLYEEVTRSYQLCDIFSVKFVSFFPPGYRPNWQTDGNLNISGILRPGGISGILRDGRQRQDDAGGWTMSNPNAVPGQAPVAMDETAFLGAMNGGFTMPTRSPETMGGCAQGNSAFGGY